MKDYLQTVTGPVAREDMGLTLPHEHLFNDFSSCCGCSLLSFFTTAC